MNALFAIRIYNNHGLWVFDDEKRGLVKEPFVAGMPEIIEAVTAHLPDAKSGFNAVFSPTPLPTYEAELTWQSYDGNDGNWYKEEKTGLRGWLCPALLKFFPKAPVKLYVQVS
jgi:hypothetical protein